MNARRSILVGALLVCGLRGAFAAGAEPPKVEKVDGHRNAIGVRVTFRKPDRAPLSGLLLGASNWYDGSLATSHVLKFGGDGRAEGYVWLDAIASIDGTSDEGATVHLKDGSSKEILFGKVGGRYLVVYSQGGNTETVDLEQVAELKCGAPARKDLEGHAMFDQWKFSPYTGEKLAPVEKPTPASNAVRPEGEVLPSGRDA
jgi:hypothetical protein